ncbi:hypothetical protein [Candidatus Spongiihabitans sp.]|uniref:hypothetical protein n=1 Tax=Candidatus Spongiihabitans sp. TaxID=3101308 RepID=UPI003C7CC4AB
MIVKELIQLLQDHDPDKKVIVRGYEGGYNEVLEIVQMDIVPNPHQKASYNGEYENTYFDDEVPDTATAAIELRGENRKSEEDYV